MDTIVRLAAQLPHLAEALEERRDSLREVRLRAGRPARFVTAEGTLAVGEPIPPGALPGLLAALMDHSVHVREEELARGFFTLEDGCRVGVCGRADTEDGRILGIEGVSSLCLRLARAVPDCADILMPHLLREGRPRSALILSPPGLGKTTCLRDAARQLSSAGLHVCVADERHELAACSRGVPTLDVGPNTDVMDGGPKATTIPMLLRAMAPQVIVTDEVGGEGDGAALADARRCGVAIVASAHGEGMDAFSRRPGLLALRELFDCVVLLGDAPGKVRAIVEMGEGRRQPCSCA